MPIWNFYNTHQNRGRVGYLMTVNGPETVEYQQSPIDYQHYILKQLKPVADGVILIEPHFIRVDFQLPFTSLSIL